jgi:hypothetical protein
MLDNRDGLPLSTRTASVIVSSASRPDRDHHRGAIPFNGSGLLDDQLLDYNQISDQAVQWERTPFL